MAYVPAIVVEVRAWGRTVGAISGAPGDYTFEYSPEWRRSGVELSPLLMPRGRRLYRFPQLNPQTFYGLPPMLADALPDKFGNSVIDAWMAAQGISRADLTPLDRLSYLGDRAMGALEFVPDNGPGLADPTALDMAELIAAARAVVAGSLGTEDEARSALAQIISVGTSAGGARPKAVVNIDEATSAITPGHTAPGPGEQAWLLKFDGLGVDHQLGSSQKYTRIEYAYSLMARAAGIDVPETRLLHETGRAHFLTRRFDRVGGERVHMQSLCGIAAVDFNLAATNDYAQLFTTIDALGLDDGARTEAFRRMAFNVAAANHDDHSKNVAFLLRNGGAWSLSPAYDVTYAHDAHSVWLDRHLMGVGGAFVGIERPDLMMLADRFAIPGARSAIADVNAAVDNWAQFAADAGLDAEAMDTVAVDLRAL
ncbi:MAG: type II toxin-antitoxin system HipA family toxin [Microbacteriaceae bacterium]